VNFSPSQKAVALNITGLELPSDPAKAVIMVSTKPAVALVWIGLGIGVAGGLIALLRRYFEGQARLSGESPARRLPRLAPRWGPWRGAAR
jgi:cytochrome c-type biogenesis protein CcmF